MKRIVLLNAIILTSLCCFAQDPSDVLRLSLNTSHGTARFVSMGGAFGALGADFSTLSYNPAGLGVFRSSELTFTPSLKKRIDDSRYINSPYSDSKTRAYIENFGLVTSFETIKEEEDGLVMVNFGIGYNRINDFYSETSIIGQNINNSIMNFFANQANGYHWDGISIRENYDPFRKSNAPWDAILAWNTFLIDTAQGSSSLYMTAINSGDGVVQYQSISSEGGVGEYTFSLAANFSNKFYFGTTIGLQDVYLKQVTLFSEEAFAQNLPLPTGYLFKSMDYNQVLAVEGYGINLKVGAIYRPIPELRLGLAAHTPTFYNLSEKYYANISSSFNDGTYSEESPLNVYDYRIESPYKIIGSAAYTFSNRGLISFDYEYIDYSTMRFGKGGDGYKFFSENSIIGNTFTYTFNAKAGGEIWIGKLALRGGYAYYGSPYKSGMDLSSSAVNVFSGGFGIRVDHLYLDWAYQRYEFSDKYLPYAISQIVSREVSQNKFLLTFGYKF